MTLLFRNNNFHKDFIFSIDLDWIPGSEQSMKKIFDIIEKHDIKPTIFFTGKFALNYSDILIESIQRGYEIGNHGWKHGVDTFENFGIQTPYNKQKELLRKSTELIEKISGVRTKIFRAPRLSISKNTFYILSELNYTIDSSIPARRFDFGRGSINNFQYFMNSREPYYMKSDLDKFIFEIPLTSLILPINMRLLRIVKLDILKYWIDLVLMSTNTLVFYLHPTEFVKVEHMQIPTGENMKFFESCSPDNFELLEKFLYFIKSRGYQSSSMQDIKDRYDTTQGL